jgi:hypothetical protein
VRQLQNDPFADMPIRKGRKWFHFLVYVNQGLDTLHLSNMMWLSVLPHACGAAVEPGADELREHGRGTDGLPHHGAALLHGRQGSAGE